MRNEFRLLQTKFGTSADSAPKAKPRSLQQRRRRIYGEARHLLNPPDRTAR